VRKQLWFKHGVAYFNSDRVLVSPLFEIIFVIFGAELFISKFSACGFLACSLQILLPHSAGDKRRGVCFCYQHPCGRCLASGMKFSRGCISRWVFFLHLFFVCFRAKWPTTHVAGRARTQFLSLHHVLTEGDPCDSGGIQPASLSKH
jgi:hypothetical protein